mmetsp:Transcript_7656/g.16661  ORF Transcript_7656/g.16661 Transcript_7656/m.16661 type:complete len:142 (+) Transcript_7656:2-427(+)
MNEPTDGPCLIHDIIASGTLVLLNTRIIFYSSLVERNLYGEGSDESPCRSAASFAVARLERNTARDNSGNHFRAVLFLRRTSPALPERSAMRKGKRWASNTTIVGERPMKGCFYKNDVACFGLGGTVAEMASPSLGSKTRI